MKITFFQTIEQSFEDNRVFSKAYYSIPFFYYFILLLAVLKVEGLRPLLAQGVETFSPRWPVFWAEFVDYNTAGTVIILFFFFSALLAAFQPWSVYTRILVFTGLLQFHAFASSFGADQHQFVLYLWVAFIFIFLPKIKELTPPSLDTRKKLLFVFFSAQAYLFLTYTMAGIGKLYAGVTQYLAGSASLFSLDAASLHIASWLNIMNYGNTIAGPFIVEYQFLGWIALVGVVYLQFFAFFVVFRPSLHRVWALALVFFHIGPYLTMRAIFPFHIFILTILFFNSPFYPDDTSWKRMVKDLPLFGFVFKRFSYFKD